MKLKFIFSFIFVTTICVADAASNIVKLSVIQVTGNLSTQDEEDKVEIAIRGSDDNLEINISGQDIASVTKTIGAQFVSQVQKIEPYIENLSTSQLNQLTSTTVIYASVVKPQPTKTDPHPVPHWLTGAVLYDGSKLGLDPDKLKSSGDDINSTVFGWLASMAQSGISWSESKNSAVSQELSTCKSNRICFDASDFTAVQNILQTKLAGNYTAEQTQKALYSVVKANELFNGPDKDNLLRVFSVINRLIALWLYQNPNTNKANFSVVNCHQDFEFLNTKQKDMNSKTTDYADSMHTFNQAQSAFVTCMQTKDNLTISATEAASPFEVDYYLMAAIGMTTPPQCVSEFNAWIAAQNNMTKARFKLFNVVDQYPDPSTQDAAAIATNTNYQAACKSTSKGGVIFGLDVKIQPSRTYTYGSSENEAVVNTVALVDPKSKETYLGYANASGQFSHFFDSNDKPLQNSSGLPIEHFYLARDGNVYDVCPEDQNCANVIMCPTKFTSGSGITSCQMLTECPADDGSGNAPTCYPLQLVPGVVANSLCLINQDINNRISLSTSLCFGQISSEAFDQLLSSQASAVKAAASVERESNNKTFSFVYGMVAMPATFAVVTKLLESGFGASFFRDVSKLGLKNYAKLNWKELGLQAKEAVDFADRAGIKNFDLQSAAEMIKFEKLSPFEAVKIARIEPSEVRSKIVDLIREQKISPIDAVKFSQLDKATQLKMSGSLGSETTPETFSRLLSTASSGKISASGASRAVIQIDAASGVSPEALRGLNLQAGDKITFNNKQYEFVSEVDGKFTFRDPDGKIGKFEKITDPVEGGEPTFDFMPDLK